MVCAHKYPGCPLYVGRGVQRLHPHSVDAVVRVALYSEQNREWGINRLSRMLGGLVRRLNVEEDYPDYMEDSARVITRLQTVVSGSLAEEIAEETCRRLRRIPQRELKAPSTTIRTQSKHCFASI